MEILNKHYNSSKKYLPEIFIFIINIILDI